MRDLSSAPERHANRLAGTHNPLAAFGAEYGTAIGMAALTILFTIILFPLNCLGLILGGVAACRLNGRPLGILGLLLNGIPVLLCLWILYALSAR